jgi:antitoxin VapB
MAKSTVFKTNQTQAIRIPKAVAFPDHVKKVDVIKRGNSLVITPEGGSWDEFFAMPGIGDDFMNDYVQPEPQIRKEY